jgi:hypothetical protein
MRRIVLLGALVLAAGCTTKHLDWEWTKASASMQQLTSDQQDCLRERAEAPPRPPSWVGGLADAGRIWLEERDRNALYEACMRQRGYTRQG